MLKLEYYAKNSRWGPNHLIFSSWNEYWKTLGYLSNPNVHRYNNRYANMNIMYERNSQTNSYSDTSRIYYYGNERRFSNEFPALYSIAKSGRGSDTFRINRKEFGETLINDLGFELRECRGRDGVILPPENRDLILNRIEADSNFNPNAWNEGYNLGNL